MLDILKLSLVFLMIVVLLRRKAGIGWVMLAAAALLALLYRMSPGALWDVAGRTVTDGITIKLITALLLIRVLEIILREKEILKRMMRASGAILRSRKAVIVSMPLLIGMLPSVGGAYFSAPMVEEASGGTTMLPEEKAFINYWFRHPWEFVLPLYPGIILASALSGIALRGLIAANLIYAVLMAATGFAFSMRGVKGQEVSGGGGGEAERISRAGLSSFLPIVSVLALVVFLNAELYTALFVVIVGLFVFYRYKPREIARALKGGFSLDVIVLIAGVMCFKGVMEASGAVGNMSAYFTHKGIPLVPMLMFLPFVTGVLTGLTIGFVSSTFPLLLSLPGGDSLAAVSLAFASGFLGVLLSPVHVCLVLTREYFKAEMGKVYKWMLPPAAIVIAAAGLEYLVLK